MFVDCNCRTGSARPVRPSLGPRANRWSPMFGAPRMEELRRERERTDDGEKEVRSVRLLLFLWQIKSLRMEQTVPNR